MRAYWMLPNRAQSDDILASDGETIFPLRTVLDPRLRPEGFSHGVPTELLEKCGPRDVLFAQRFPHGSGSQSLFVVTTTAGLDASGRLVHLGLLFILGAQERPRFDLPYAGLPEDDRTYAGALVQRLTSPAPGDVWAQSVRDLGELTADGRPATNVALERSVARFHALYVVGPDGSITKAGPWRKPRPTAMLLLMLFAVVGAGLLVRACKQPSPSVRSGVVTWRSS